ncbi:MAG TPA: cytochrome c, partial [Thermoanaerobaculia bacterium]|nr:cytochrome c [Thermoanaerobaculia bacterium]
MKTFLKVVGILLLVVVAVAVCAIAWLALRRPAQRPASTEKIEATPERLARGKYLAHHVTDCFGCHSDHIDAFGFPPKPGTEGQGGMSFSKADGFPGFLAVRNITPDPETGIGNWTDGEILRAIREGVDREGKALFPMMPYGGYKELGDEDAKAIVAYLRTIKPIRHA